MRSKIAEHIKLKNEPVAIIRTDEKPENAVMFKEGVWGCVVALLNAASKGKVASMSEKTTVCKGGKAGTGFHPFETGMIEYFLSTGEKGPKEGEFYKESPELALDYIHGMPTIEPKEYLVLKPYSLVTEDDNVDSIVFMVNADQISGLITLANYDMSTQDNVIIKFGSGCAQSMLYTIADGVAGNDYCTIGLTDPSARKCIDKDILSFSIPYKRFLVMEEKADGSFFKTETWEVIKKRID